jgi:hypothetical protein
MPEIEPDVLIFRVDFNNLDANGRVKGSFAHAISDRVPQEGERAILMDAEGNACWSVVTHVGARTLRFEMDLATWTSGEELSTSGVPAANQPVFQWSPEPVAA